MIDIFSAFSMVFDFQIIMLIFGGTALGILVGALPGLSATMGLAVLLPISFYMSPIQGILLLLGMYTGSNYGGSFSAILLNIPGAPPAVMTALDGNPMARKGEAGRAIVISTLSSFLGGVFGVLCLIIIAPWLARFALDFGPAEYALLALFGLSTIVAVAGKSMKRGFIGVVIGLMLATIGLDQFTNVPRFTFGRYELMSGVSYIPLVIGVFGLSEVLSQILSLKDTHVNLQKVGSFKTSKSDIKKILNRFLPSSIIGTIIGVLPGAGGTIASIIAYNQSVQTSKHPETFGKGEPEGLIAAESSNNAAVGGSLVPLLTLGIPGSSPAAILLGALMIHNLRPGPMLFLEQRPMVNAFFIGLMIAQFAMVIVGLLAARIAPHIISAKQKVMMPVITLLCIIGAYALNSSFFDVKLMLIFGVVGFFLKLLGIKPAPIVLGLILGPMFETNFRSALELSQNGYLIFVTRPISIVLLILIALLLVWPFIQKRMTEKKKQDAVSK
ncbi:MAG: tripartite tricarboxylate transporter permease [Sphaerochaetaceae bacterium]|nr:tripartite tricarboxylate transporter permease [Sphaerochaetaceae bacterium]